jgi:hypothetical protein
MSENGGLEEDTRYRVLQAQVSLNKYNAIWKSDLKLRQKVLSAGVHSCKSEDLLLMVL